MIRKRKILRKLSLLLLLCMTFSLMPVKTFAESPVPEDMVEEHDAVPGDPDIVSEDSPEDGPALATSSIASPSGKDSGIEDFTDETSNGMEEDLYFEYDPQPETLEEVQALIDAYEEEYHAALMSSGYSAALEIQKPRWEYEVDRSLMPVGWRCDFLTDEASGAVYWTFFPSLTAFSSSVTVTGGAQLPGVINGTSDDMTIELSADFSMTGTVTLPALANGRSIVIDGGGIELPGGYTHFTFASGNAGEYTLKNMTLGTGTGGIKVNAGSGQVTIEQVTFDGLSSSAVSLGSQRVVIKDSQFLNGTSNAISGEGNSVAIEGSLFKDNVAAFGGAILGASNTTYNITNCSFVGNRGTWPGYNGGAIGADGRINIVMNISNSYFEENAAENGNISAKTGGRGGAIAYYNTNQSYLTISQCYFKGNKASTVVSTADGGALSYYTGTSYSNTWIIEDSTFEENIARDDAGAIHFEKTVPNGACSLTVRNCTFYKNAGGHVDGVYYGGAIQACSSVSVALESNTFYGNIHERGYGGNDLGEHSSIYTVGGISILQPSWVLKNNLFVNDSAASTKQNTQITANRVTDNGGNVGADYSIKQNVNLKVKDIFGANDPQLNEYGNERTAGVEGSEYETCINTLMIVPRHVTGSGTNADGEAAASQLTFDERGKLREAGSEDAGAVEIAWVKFDSGEGNWEGLTEEGFVLGESYYIGTETKNYWLISDVGGNVLALSDSNMTPPSAGMILLGWDTDPSADEVVYEAGDTVDSMEQTVYAVWGEAGVVTYGLTYHKNDSSGATKEYGGYTLGESVPVKALTAVEDWTVPEGKTFLGWTDTADVTESSLWYQPGDLFEIRAEKKDLYAQWEDTHGPLPEYASADVTGTKRLTGRALEAGEFSFTLNETTDGRTYAQTVTNDADGNFAFPAITYNAAGTYTYIVSEVNGGISGISYDNTVYSVTAEVTVKGNDALTAAVTYQKEGIQVDEISFQNTYSDGGGNNGSGESGGGNSGGGNSGGGNSGGSSSGGSTEVPAKTTDSPSDSTTILEVKPVPVSDLVPEPVDASSLPKTGDSSTPISGVLVVLGATLLAAGILLRQRSETRQP